MGLNHSNGTGTDTLEHTTLEFVDVDDCMLTLLGSYWANVYNMDNKVVCAIGEKTDTCQGDSGGPLFRITDAGPEIIGLTSWGYGCAIPDLPAVYTSTSHYYEWMAEVANWTAATLSPTAPTAHQ